MPGLLDRFQKVLGRLTPERTPAQQWLDQLRERLVGRQAYTVDVATFDGVPALLEGDPALQCDVLLEAVHLLTERPFIITGDYYERWSVLSRLANLLLARKPPLSSPQVVTLMGAWADSDELRNLTVGQLLSQAEALELDDSLRSALGKLDAAARKRMRANEYGKLAARVATLLKLEPTARLESGGAFSEAVFAQLEQLPEAERQAWRELFQLGFSCGARPTAKWAGQVKAVVERIGDAAFDTHARAWLALGPTPGGARDAYVPETDTPFLRALVFAVGVMRRGAMAGDIGELALACYRKIPNRGPVCQGAGNACLWTLGEIGLDGVGQLGMLKMRVKYAVALRLIEKALGDAAARAGLSPEDLEEIGVPTFDLDEHGRHEQDVGGVLARLEVVDGREAKLSFVPAGGKAQASPPAALKGTPELKALKARVKDIDAMLVAQRLRVERTFITGRSWPFDTWRARLFEHPLLLGVARRLVWQLGADRSFAFDGARFVDATGAEVVPKAGDEVTLWHPIDRADSERAAWTRWLSEHGVETPFKQVDRETFELPAGETRTGRFAGRRIAQHRFHALCRERGWQYRLQGGFDGHNNAQLTLRSWRLAAELEVAPPHATGTSDMGIYLQVETGDVVFTFETPAPPRVVSEVLRDVALFVEE